MCAQGFLSNYITLNTRVRFVQAAVYHVKTPCDLYHNSRHIANRLHICTKRLKIHDAWCCKQVHQ